jgi:hypothetical protein
MLMHRFIGMESPRFRRNLDGSEEVWLGHVDSDGATGSADALCQFTPIVFEQRQTASDHRQM